MADKQGQHAKDAMKPKGLLSGWNKNFYTAYAMKTHWELIPLAIIPLAVCTFATYCIFRTATTSYDIRWKNKHDDQAGPHEGIKPHQNIKMYTIDPKKFKPNAELESIKDELKEAAPAKD